MSTGLGCMEPTSHGNGDKGGNGNKAVEDANAPPRQSLECWEYLKKVQDFQVKMIAIKVGDGGDN